MHAQLLEATYSNSFCCSAMQVISSAALFGPNFASVVDQLYPASSYPTVFARLAAIEGDRDYTCQVRHYADLLSGSGIGSLYVYQLRKVLPYPNPQSFLGAFHTSDVRPPSLFQLNGRLGLLTCSPVQQLNYVFGTSCMSDFWPYGPPTCYTGNAPQFWTPAPGNVDYLLSQQVMSVWGSFLWYAPPLRAQWRWTRTLCIR
jgi:hypothetical protein